MDLSTSSAPRTPAQADSLVVAGRYRLLELIGTGSMGRVYLGERLGLKRRVAVKFLRQSLARNPKFRQRFERELTIMSQLDHPNCVSMLDYGVDRAPFVVMDYIDGCTLQTLIAEGGISVPEALELGRQLLCGLAHAHRLGIVHRDIKPANLIVGHPTGTGALLRIVDFGLAKVTAAEDDTSPNLAIGTPSYMSPEQTEARRVDARSDVYSAGVVMFELLTGRKPFIAEDTLTLLEMHRHAPLPSLERICPDLPAAQVLEPILVRAMAKDPGDRYPTAIEFADALAAALASLQTDDPSADSEELGFETIEAQLPSPTHRSRPGLLALLVLAGIASASSLYAGELRSFAGRVRSEVQEWVALTADAPAAEERAPAPAHRVPAPTEPAGARSQPSAASTRQASPMLTTDEIAAREEEGTTAPVLAFDTLPPALADGDDVAQPAAPAEAADMSPETTPNPASEPAPSEPETGATPEHLALAIHDVNVEVRSIADVKRLIREGNDEAALQGVETLLHKSPKSASLHYLHGKLYFEKHWWTDGLKSYALAIENDARYRKNGRIIRHSIDALGSTKTRARARQLLRRSIGKAALAPLARAARKHRNANVRREAARLAKEMRRPPMRTRRR